MNVQLFLLVVLALIVLTLALAVPVQAAEKDLSKGGKILLLGDSILDSHQGNARVENVMQKQFTVMKPGVKFEVVNLARGGMWIGPADPGAAQGISKPLFDSPTTGWYFEVLKRCPKADAIVILFGGNDSKVYPPEEFYKKLSDLCDRLAKDYPQAKIFLATGMCLDPRHSGGYWIQPSQVKGFKQGDNRNAYLLPYYVRTRELAKMRGFALADLCERVQAETKADNWDLRMRSDNTLDASKDAEHPGDMGWFSNIHANYKGTAVIADLLVKAILGMDPLKTFPKADSAK